MPMLVPRLRLTDRTVARLRKLAEKHKANVADIIAALVETALAEKPRPEGDALFRLVLVGERLGLGVDGPAAYPSLWKTAGGLTDGECRDIAAAFIAWKREQNEIAGHDEEAAFRT